MSGTYEAIKILLNNLDNHELTLLYQDLQKLVDVNVLGMVDDPTNKVLYYLYQDDPVTAMRSHNNPNLENLLDAIINYNLKELQKIIDSGEWTDRQLYILNVLKGRLIEATSD